MKQKKKDIKSTKTRRKFLNKGLVIGAGLITGSSEILQPKIKRVKMLTADGKVVEVDTSKIKLKNLNTKNKDILNWMDQEKLKSNLKSQNQ